MADVLFLYGHQWNGNHIEWEYTPGEDFLLNETKRRKWEEWQAKSM